MLHLFGVALLAVYVGGVWKFWTGFGRTNFSHGKWYLGALWPILMIRTFLVPEPC